MGIRKHLLFLLISAIGIALPALANTEQPQVLEKAPVADQVIARILYDGKPILDRTERPASAWVRNEDTGQAAECARRYEKGTVRIAGLQPGKYGVQVTIDDNPSNPVNHPGDYYSWTGFEIARGKITLLDVNLRKVIRMISPEDNNNVMEGWEEKGCEPRAMFPGKAFKIAWDPVGVGVQYAYTVERIACPYRFLGRVVEGTTQDTNLVLDLPTSAPGEFYILNLHASHDDRPVGVLMTWGPNFLAWDYRFRCKINKSK